MYCSGLDAPQGYCYVHLDEGCQSLEGLLFGTKYSDLGSFNLKTQYLSIVVQIGILIRIL